MRDLVTFVEFKNRKKHLKREVTFRLEPATLFKVILLLHGCFSRFLNVTNDTKSRKAPLSKSSQMISLQRNS